MTTAPAPDRALRRRRFARVGRVVPVALVQIIGTLAASRWAAAFAAGDRSGGPWQHAGPLASPTHAVTVGPLALVLLVAGVVVLPFRWRWPTAVLGITLATTIGYAFAVSARGPFVAALTMALVNAWLRGHRRAASVAAAIAFLVLPWADVLVGRTSALPWSTMTLALGWLAVTLALSELTRVRIVRASEAHAAREAEARRRQDDERVRIARELHDSVAHNMSLISLQAGVALHLGSELPEPTREALTSIRDASKEALVELRTVLGVLRSVDEHPDPERSPTPGLDRLGDLVARAEAAGLAVTLRVSGDPAAVGRIVSRNAFRIVQESVTNVMKHAPGHTATIEVDVTHEVVELTVVDRPAAGGTAPAAAPAAAETAPGAGGLGAIGNGIIGMRERATAVGGDFAAGPRPDGSWRVHARLPRTDGGTA